MDSHETLYVANWYQSIVEEYRAGESDPFKAITDVDGPDAIAPTKSGWLYIASGGVATVGQIAVRPVNP